MSKKTIAVLFGGMSSEHDVSCVSACNVIDNINKEDYDILLIGITKNGRWLYVSSADEIKSGKWQESKVSAAILPDAVKKSAVLFKEDGAAEVKIDVCFPVMHGLYGEDGTVQGLLELAKIPYVGCGVLASSISMDKLYTKIVVDTLGIRQAKYVSFLEHEYSDTDAMVKKAENAFKYPMFIKPSNSGSSCGISKAHNRKELIDGLKLAQKHDRKILVEEAIIGRELECGVLGGFVRNVKETLPVPFSIPTASGVGEILAAAEFYDYDAKYNNEASKTIISPILPDGKLEEIQKDSVSIFRAVDGFGFARIDFFMEAGTNEIVFNELNTIPGFTAISMYPMLLSAAGIDKKKLVASLINYAFLR